MRDYILNEFVENTKGARSIIGFLTLFLLSRRRIKRDKIM